MSLAVILTNLNSNFPVCLTYLDYTQDNCKSKNW